MAPTNTKKKRKNKGWHHDKKKKPSPEEFKIQLKSTNTFEDAHRVNEESDDRWMDPV